MLLSRLCRLRFETSGYMGKEAVKFVNRLGDIACAAECGRITKGAFVRWEMQLLSLTVHMLRCTAGVGRSCRVSIVCVTMLELQCQC